MLTEEMLRALWPNGDAKVPGLIEGIASAAPAVFPKYGLTNDLMIAQATASMPTAKHPPKPWRQSTRLWRLHRNCQASSPVFLKAPGTPASLFPFFQRGMERTLLRH